MNYKEMISVQGESYWNSDNKSCQWSYLLPSSPDE